MKHQKDMPKHKETYSYMKNATFALGRANPQTIRKKAIRNPRSVSQIVKRPLWRILPNHTCMGLDLWIDTLEGTSFFEKRKALFEGMNSVEHPPVCPWKFPRSSSEFRNVYIEKAHRVLGLLHQNQLLRWRLKRFFTSIRIRRFPLLNDKDPITMEACKQPVMIPMFSLRKTYLFEAKSFARLCHTQLLTNDGHIPTPIYPKNPWTNQEFPLGQLVSLFHQCKQFGHTTWAMESFAQCHFQTDTLMVLHSKPLRLHAFRATMANRKSWDCMDTLYDFIKSQHQAHNVPFQKMLYRWATSHAAMSNRIELWRNLCIQWYEIDILTDDPDTKQEKQDQLLHDILKACGFPQDLKDLHTRTLQ